MPTPPKRTSARDRQAATVPAKILVPARGGPVPTPKASR